jgi:starch-binding outer membrane protein, SusD/RagB family
MKRNIVKLFCALSLMGGFASCTDYLDKSPDSTVWV